MNPWESLVREHLPVVTGVALRILGDRAAAEDVAQDVFLHLLQNPHALDHAANVRSFLCRSSINRALDRIRERDRRERREAAVEHASRDPNPLDAAWHDEIRRSVEALPEPERDAVAARYFRGLTVREAAKEMRVSVGTVCNRIEAGVKRLRKWLGAAAFGLIFAVLEDDAFAVETSEAVVRLLYRRRQRGDGSSEKGVTAGKRLSRSVGVAAGLACVAAWLLSLWVGRPGEILDSGSRPLEIASMESPGRGSSMVYPESGAAPKAPAAKHAAALQRVAFRAEGFLVRDGDGLTLVSPSLRDPKRVEGRPMDRAIFACSVHPGRNPEPVMDSFTSQAVLNPATFFDTTAVTDPGGRTFRLLPNDLTRNLLAGETRSFDGWLDGIEDASRLPRAWIATRAAWIDEAQGIAELVEIEETEFLSLDWLQAWRAAVAANAALAAAFTIPPGASRRAEALVAVENLATALENARLARRGETAVGWRTRRESELEIASAGALACLGREEELPGDCLEPSEPSELAGAREAGLELEPVPVLQRSALALRGGARILSVAAGSAADRAGLRSGDIIWRVTPVAGGGRSVARDVLRPEDVAAFLDDALVNSWGGLEFEVVRGLDTLVFEIRM